MIMFETYQLERSPLTKLVAEGIGSPCACRAVGTALKNNPHAPTVPCHRVIGSNFAIGAFMGDVNQGSIKAQMLAAEGIKISGDKVYGDKEYQKSIIYVPSKVQLVIEV